MTAIEERARAAMAAIAATVDDAPPLRVAPAPGAPAHPRSRQRPQGRRWRTWIKPAVAGIAMIAVGLTLAVVRDIPKRDAAPAAVPGPGGLYNVPRYYVALDGPTESNPATAHVVVGDTFSGKKLFTVGPFAGGGAVSVTAAADDRTFVVGTEHYTGPSVAPTAWYLIRLTPGLPPRANEDVAATVRPLPISVPAGSVVESTALSADGTKLAMMATQRKQTVLRIYSVPTGAVVHTWSEPLPAGGAGLWWTADGRTLAWGSAALSHFGVWLLQVTKPGHSLSADSKFAWNTVIQDNYDLNAKSPFGCAAIAPSVTVTADGTIVCGAWGVFRSPGSLPPGTCPAAPPWNAQGFLEYSTATARLTRTLYRYDSSCVPYFGPAQVLWASPSGDTVIGYFYFYDLSSAPRAKPVVRFGIFGENTFTPLPELPAAAPGTIGWYGPGTVAW